MSPARSGPRCVGLTAVAGIARRDRRRRAAGPPPAAKPAEAQAGDGRRSLPNPPRKTGCAQTRGGRESACGSRGTRARPDPAFGAFQRGYYLTAFNEATKRIDASGDPKAMTLLGELYANGFGVAAQRCQGRRMVQARGRPRRCERDVCPRHVPHHRPRRAKTTKTKRCDCSRRPPSSATRRPPMTSVCSISKAGNSPRTMAALPNCFAPPPRPAVRKPCTPWRSFTSEGQRRAEG